MAGGVNHPLILAMGSDLLLSQINISKMLQGYDFWHIRAY